LPNYSSGNVKANSIRPVSACLNFLKRFGIFYKWFGISCSLGPGNHGYGIVDTKQQPQQNYLCCVADKNIVYYNLNIEH